MKISGPNLKTRKCIDCGKRKKLSAYSKRPNVNKTKTVYYMSMCRVCNYLRTTAWKYANLKKHRAYQVNYQRNLRKNAKRK